MADGPYSLAIETSGRDGSVSLGYGQRLLATRDMPARQRHTVDLMPALDGLCRKHGVIKTQLGQIFVSIGPGSFTGLRIAVATAKMLALALDLRVVAVPTVDVVAANAPAPDDPATTLAVCLNVKRDAAYVGLYRRLDQAWTPQGEPSLRHLNEVTRLESRPLWLLGDPLFSQPPEARPEDPPEIDAGVTMLPAATAHPRSETVWKLGKAMAERGQFTDPLRLLPLYARPPEAVELWAKRMGNHARPQAASERPSST